jgi:hypothetical protein
MSTVSTSNRRLAAVTVAGTGGFVAVVTALSLTQSGYSITRQSMNELVLGGAGWLVRPAFGALGVAAIALGAVLWRICRARIAPVVLALTGCLQFAMAVFTTVHGDPTTSGRVHGIVGFLTLVGNIAAMYFSIRPLMQSATWRHLAVPAAAWAGIATICIIAASPSSIGDEHFGIGQRVMFAILLSWQATVGVAVLSHGHSPRQRGATREAAAVPGVSA